MVRNTLWSAAASLNVLFAVDLRTDNFLMRPKDDECFRLAEMAELTDPGSRKIDGDRVIYTSRGILHKSFDRIVLSVFGETRSGTNTAHLHDDIQPLEYRAHAVLLGIPFSYPVDIWNAGLMVYYMFLSTLLLLVDVS